MINLEISPAEQAVLNEQRYHHPHPRVQRKMEALWLKSHGLAHHQICLLADISEATLVSYLKEYQQGGIEQLKEINFYQPQSELVAHTSTLEKYFEQHPPATVKEAMGKIEELTGLKRSETQVRHFIKGLGLKCRKVGMIPAKADPVVQAQFKTEKLEPVLAEAKQGQRKVFFVDAAHFVLAPFLGYLWSFVRLFIPAPSGRQRFNVLAALDAISHELIMVTNESYINAESVVELLRQVREFHPHIPITFILDNARYQKCLLVMEQAAALNIELLYLPSYSPNLNLIERLWKFVKKKCLYSKYYASFGPFKEAISNCLAHTQDTYQAELDSLLTLKFQSFEHVEKFNL
jgi:transposase